MGNVNSTIVVNIKALVEGTGKVRDLASSVTGLEGATGKASTSMARADLAGTKLDGMFGKLSTSTKGFAFSISGLGKKIEGEFAPLSAAGRKIEDFVRKEKQAIAELERVRSQRAAVASRDTFFSSGKDPFAQGVDKFGETPLRTAGKDIASADATTLAQENIRGMETQRAALRKLNDEAVRSGKEGTANINRLLKGFESVDKVRGFERLLRSTAQLRTGLQRSVGDFKVLTAVVAPFASLGKLVTGVFATMLRQIQFAIAAFALLAAAAPAAGFVFLIKEGLQFNDIMEQQRIGLGALIQSTHDLFNVKEPNKPLEGVAAYQAATILAETATNRLRIKIIPLRATSEQLLPIFNQVVTAGTAAGLTLTQLEDTFVSLTAAAQILSIPTDRLGTEIRLLLSGVTRETSRLGPALFGTAAAAREFVKQHRAAGDLFPALQTKLVAYNAALDASEQSYATLKENTVEAFQILAGIATKGLFEKIKAGLQLIARGFFDLKAGKLKTEFEALFNFINNALTKAGDFLVGLLGKAIAYIVGIAKYVQDNSGYVSAILGDLLNIATQMGGLVGDVASIAGDAESARNETVSWHVVLGFVAITWGLIRDIANALIGIIQAVGGVVVFAFLGPLEAVLTILGLISDTAKNAADAIASARRGAIDFATSGAFRFGRGVNFENSNNATDTFLNRNPNIGTNPPPAGTSPEEFNARLRRNAAGAGKGRGQNAADSLAHRLQQLKKQTTDALYDLYSSQLDIERAEGAKEFNLLRDATGRAGVELSRSYEKRLASITDYYDAKDELDKSATAQEKSHLRDQFKIDEKEFERKRQAIIDRANEAIIDPKNKDVVVQEEIEKQANIDIQEHRNALKVKEIELDQALLLLDGKQAQQETENNNARQDAMDEFEQRAREVSTALTEISDPLSADIRRIAEQYKDDVVNFLSNTELASPAIVGVIEQLRLLGAVTTSELTELLAKAGIKFDDLDQRVKNLITAMKQAENQATFKSLGDKVGILQGGLGINKDEIQDRVNLGVVNEAQGRREVAAAEQKTRLELEKVLALMAKIPGLTDQQKLSIEGLKQETSTLGREFDTVGNTINGVIASDIGNLFDTLLSGTENFGQTLQAFFSGLLINIGKAIFQAIVLKTILSALGLAGVGTVGAGSASGVGGVIAGLAGKFADGGEVSGPGTGTSDSILARVSHGEWVIPAARVAQYGRGLMASLTKGTFGMRAFAVGGPVDSAGPGSSSRGFSGLRNINVLDPELLTNYLTSSSGEQQILNVISHNPTKFKRALGIA